MACEAGLSDKSRKWPLKGFKIPDFVNFLKLGLTDFTSASGCCPRVHAVNASLTLAPSYLHIPAHPAKPLEGVNQCSAVL